MTLTQKNTSKTGLITSKKVLTSLFVATVLITGMIFMSSTQAFAHKLITNASIGFDNPTPIDGDIVVMTGTVTTSDTAPQGQSPFHPAANPVTIGTGKIQQGLNADESPASECPPDHYGADLSSAPVDSNGQFTHNFDTLGLGGQTLVFRAHYVTPGMGHVPATAHSDCTLLEIAAGDPFDGFKTWTHTDYNWDRICTETEIVEEPAGVFTEICIADRPANIYNNGQEDPQDPPNLLPDDDVLADSLDLPVEDGISDVQVQVKKNGEISNMNPGAIYALTTVNIQANLDMLKVAENYGECTDTELELLNQNNLSRNVKIAVADPNGDVTEVTDRLYDELDLGVVFVEPVDNDHAIVKINDSTLLTDESTVFVLVKFDDQLKGEDSSILPLECLNSEDVTSTIIDVEFEKTFEASLRISAAP